MNYGIWADILVSHEYFCGKYSDFTFVPEPESETTIRREGFLIQEAIGGIRLIAPEEVFASKIELVFWVYPTDRNVWSATDFENIPEDSIAFAKISQGSLQWESCTKDKIPESMQVPKPMFGIAISNQNNVDNSRVTIPLKTKHLKWRYNISGLSVNRPVEIAGYKPNTDAPSFDIVEEYADTIVFMSQQDIPLRYGAPPLFQLREKNSSKAIIKCLPNMDARSIATISLDKNRREIVAESFINT